MSYKNTKGLKSPLKLSLLSKIVLFGPQKPKSWEPPATHTKPWY